MKLYIVQFSSSFGCFLDLRHENPRRSPETTFFPYDNDAICTPTLKHPPVLQFYILHNLYSGGGQNW